VLTSPGIACRLYVFLSGGQLLTAGPAPSPEPAGRGEPTGGDDGDTYALVDAAAPPVDSNDVAMSARATPTADRKVRRVSRA
jgi:hypothetical protein